MTREQALELLQQHLHNQNLVKHCLAVEACMRELAGSFRPGPGTLGAGRAAARPGLRIHRGNAGNPYREDRRDAGRAGAGRGDHPCHQGPQPARRARFADGPVAAGHRPGQRLHHRLRPDAPRQEAGCPGPAFHEKALQGKVVRQGRVARADGGLFPAGSRPGRNSCCYAWAPCRRSPLQLGL